jgi:hypothetical protein
MGGNFINFTGGNIGVNNPSPVRLLDLITTQTNSYVSVASFMAPNNAVAGNTTQFYLGTSQSIGNSISWTFRYEGNNSASNRMGFEFNGYATPVLTMYRNGNAIFGGTVDAGYKLDVQGTIRSTGDGLFNDITIGQTGGGRYIKWGLNDVWMIVGTTNIANFNANGVNIPNTLTAGGGTSISFGSEISGYSKKITFTPSVNHTQTHVLIGQSDSAYGGNTTQPGNIWVYAGKNTNNNLIGNIHLGHNGTEARGRVAIGSSVAPTHTLDVTGTGRFTEALYSNTCVYATGNQSDGALNVSNPNTSGFSTVIINRADVTNCFGSIAFMDRKTGANNRGFSIGIGMSTDPTWADGDFIMGNYIGSGNWNQSARIYNATGNWRIGGTGADSGFKLDVIGPVRLYPRGNINGGFEFTYNDVYNILHSNTLTNISGGNYLFIGGVGLTMLGTNKNDTLSQVTIGYQSWQGNLVSSSAIFDIRSTTKGFLQPRMTTTQRDAITSPATGLSVYNTATNTNDFYNGTAWVSNAAGNIYTADGTLSADRTVTYTGTDLTFFTVRPSVGNRFITFHNSGRVTFNGTTENTSYEVNVNGQLLAGAGSMIGGTSGVNFDSGNLRLIFQNWSSVSFVRAEAYSVLYSDGANASLGNGAARLNIASVSFSTNGGGVGSGAHVYSIGSGTNSITTGAYTVSIGSENLDSITNGSTNIAIGGRWAGSGVSRGNTGNHSSSIFLGVGTGATTNSTTLTNTTIIGHDITTDASNTVILGRSDQNVTIGGVLNAGYKLDVQGTARVTGNVLINSLNLQADGKIWYSNIWGERWALNMAGDGDLLFTSTKGSQNITFRGESTYTHIIASSNVQSSIYIGRFEGREGFIAATQNANTGNYTVGTARICAGYTPGTVSPGATNTNGVTL